MKRDKIYFNDEPNITFIKDIPFRYSAECLPGRYIVYPRIQNCVEIKKFQGIINREIRIFNRNKIT